MPRRISNTWPIATSNARPGARRCRRPARAAAALSLALAVGCSLTQRPGFDPIDAVFPSYSEEDSREIGYEFDRSLQESVVVIDDPVVSGFINDLGRSILAASGDPTYVYRFRLIEDPSLNAFAVFGGYVYFHTGTVLAAGSVDELAGVMGHEIAHVRLRHHARMAERAQIPDLVAAIAGIGAAVGTGELGALIAAQGVNVALKLRFSREYEAEADQEGTRLMAAAGYDPAGIALFFERLLELQRGYPNQLPPYLFSHPDVERRIGAVAIYAQDLPYREPTLAESFEPAFRKAQARLAALLSQRGGRLLTVQPASDPALSGPLLAAALAAEERGELDEAEALLARARAATPADPRVYFESGELARRREQATEAAHHYRAAIAFDPTRALVFLRLGETYESLDERQMAVFAYEHAARRAGPTGSLRGRADREIEKLTFTVVEAAGFADGNRQHGDTPFGASLEAFPADASELVWWARLGPRFADQPERLSVTFTGPGGNGYEGVLETGGGRTVGATLTLADPTPGLWNVEARLDGDPIDRRAVWIGPSLNGR
jgi:predicted Zn-dependent protease